MPAPDAQMRELQSLCRENNLEEALATAERLITREQAFGQVHAIRIDLLLSLARRSDAESAFDSALHEFGSMSEALDGLAYYARRLGRHALSKQLYERATQDRPHDAQLWYNLATGERSLGELEKAYSASARALALQPDHMPAVLLRSEVRTATPDENHVGDLKARLSSNNSRQRMFLAYAAGKELHDLGRYAEAFEAFAKGAAARRKALSYDVATDERKIARIIEVFGANTTQSTPTPTAHDRHIFIVGLPRSGTTLVERILGSLPDVESNGETDNFSNALLQSAPPLPGDVFQRCAAAPADQVARRYEALAGRKNPDTRVIEKLPLNYLYVGAIARSFERSPIVWVRRHPLENCFAMFRTLFGEGYPFSYDFGDLARYYAAYDRLMRHWVAVMPGRMIEIAYEDLVSAPALAGAELARRCNLKWMDEALDLGRNTSASLTASAAQIRGSIYSSSTEMRRRYHAELAPLAKRLKELGIHVPD